MEYTVCSIFIDKQLGNRLSFQFGSNITADSVIKNQNENYVVTNLSVNAIGVRSVNSVSPAHEVMNYNFHRRNLKVDLNFAKRLRQAQNDSDIPLVNDIVVSKKNNTWEVIVIINNGNTMNEKYNKLRSVNVELLVGNKIYPNSFKQVHEAHLRVLKYEVPNLPVSGTISLFDCTTNVSYQYLPYRALINQPKRKIAICAYISDYNTLNEIISFLAYYILQKIDNVILYCSVNCDTFRIALKKEIENGYVILYEYPWPLTKKYGAYQRSIQGSHINSCYYRHRNYFEYIISQDVDEYFYSEQYPYDLYTAIRRVYKLNPDNRSLAVI